MENCRELEQTSLHRALSRMSRKATRKGVLRWTPSEVADDLARYVYNSHNSMGRARDLIKQLIDNDAIIGLDTGGFQILVSCSCPPPPLVKGRNLTSTRKFFGRQDSLVPTGHWGGQHTSAPEPERSGGGRSLRFSGERSAQTEGVQYTPNRAGQVRVDRSSLEYWFDR
jgi:hypothetical protein